LEAITFTGSIVTAREASSIVAITCLSLTNGFSIPVHSLLKVDVCKRRRKALLLFPVIRSPFVRKNFFPPGLKLRPFARQEHSPHGFRFFKPSHGLSGFAVHSGNHTGMKIQTRIAGSLR